MRKIDSMIEADGGAQFRGWLGRVLPHIGDAYRDDPDEGFRGHLGASILGEECGRKIWYTFRWASKPKFPGRVLRLFNRGHLEEGRIIAQLLMIGAQVWQQDANGKQFRISWASGHAGGSGDGLTLGIPDVPELMCVLECKTHGEKSFIELAGKLPEWRNYVLGNGPFTGKGVKAAKPEHYIQMQLYMRKMGYTMALYIAVCKNTDDQYMELVTLNPELADQFADRGEKLVWIEGAPPRINNSPGFFKCRFCDDKPVCHLKAMPAINCRTCQFSKPIPDGKWQCLKHNMELVNAKQQVGCPDWHKNEDF
jgi:hypothetical protein